MQTLKLLHPPFASGITVVPAKAMIPARFEKIVAGGSTTDGFGVALLR